MVPAGTPAQQAAAEPAIHRNSLLEGPPATAPATERSASVTGTVLDESGASVSGADVSLLPRDGTQSHMLVSGAGG
jgi:protocatechuate 3,4-dioxygenase beta subunit